MASTEIYDPSLDGDTRFACKELVIDYSAIGRRYQLTLNGDRGDLDALARSIALADSSASVALNTIANLSDLQQGLIPATVLARCPRLSWKGEGLMADLLILGEDGLATGDHQVGGTSDQYSVPDNTSARIVYEPNDVALAYGLPFRAGFKWDLTVAIDAVPSDVTAVLDAVGVVDVTTFTWLALINLWQEGALQEPQRQALYDYINTTSDGPSDWMLRYLRGETNYRFWIPCVTVTTRTRTLQTLPDTGQIVDVAAGATPPDYTAGVPEWTGAPETAWFGEGDAAVGIDYSYWKGSTEIDFAGDFWTQETQWHGFLDMDDELYENPNP